MPTSFGQVIPVLGLNNGFPGAVSRIGERLITARQVLSTTPNSLAFGAPCVIIADATGGTYQSVADFIAAAASNSGSVYSQFAGIAVREVQTQLTYPAGSTPGLVQVGYYQPGQLAEVLERGSITVAVVEGSPTSQGQVYVRVYANTATFTPTANTTLGSNVLSTVSSFTGLLVGQLVTGTGIPSGTYVTALNSTAATATLNNNATATGTGVTITFSNSPTGIGDIEAAVDTAATTTMTAAAGSTSVTIASATGVAIGQIVNGAGIAPGTGVANLSGTTVTLSQATIAAAAAGTAVTFTNTLALPGVVFRTGYLDANGVAEITLKSRVAA